MSKNVGINIFKHFSTNEFVEQYKRITKEILEINNFSLDIDEKELKIFLFTIKFLGYRILKNIKYIANSNINFILSKKLQKKLFKNQIIFLFIFLYSQNKSALIIKENNRNNYERKYGRFYNNLYQIIDNVYCSQIKNDIYSDALLEIKDIFEIIRLNLVIGLNDLSNRSYIFNISFHYLLNYFYSNENNNNIKSYLNSILSQIFEILKKSENNLYFLRRDENLENLTILDLINFLSHPLTDDNLYNLIMEILSLIYLNNYSTLISDYFLNKIKECFYGLEENNKSNIMKCIKNIKGFISFLETLFSKEENEINDTYKPSNYFVFSDSIYNGINYNPNVELLKKNFTLIFSFNVKETKENEIYPLITYVNSSEKNDILFNISIQNKKLTTYIQGDNKLKSIYDITENKSYLIIIEYKSMGLLKNKLKIYCDGQKHETSVSNINYKSICFLDIGYISEKVLVKNKIFTNAKNFVGLIGPIIQFSNIFDDKNFIQNIFDLKGKYEMILLMNKNINLDYFYDYEKYQNYSESDIIYLKDYFSDLSKKISDDFQFSLCPLSIINNPSTSYFRQDIYNLNTDINKKEIVPYFITRSIANSKTVATYAKKNQKSISIFVENDGISIYTLIFEYFYNILRLFINYPKEEKIELCNEMFNVFGLILKNFLDILCYFKLDNLSDVIDTFGFTIKKLFFLLIDIQPLNNSLINIIIESGNELIAYTETLNINKTKTIILDFIAKFISLIFSSKYININEYSSYEKLFEFINLVMIINHDLVNKNFINELLSFIYILDPIAFDKYKNNPSETTIETNKEYKNMRKRYKNLLGTYFHYSDSLNPYINFFENVFSNQNLNLTEKYELIKIYYIFINIELLYKNNNEKKNSNKSFFKAFKNEKNYRKNISKEKELFQAYHNSLLKLMDKIQPIDTKNLTYSEIIKAILMILMYEHKTIISTNMFNESNEEVTSSKKKTEHENSNNKKEGNTKENIYFFSSFSIEQMKNQTQNDMFRYNSISFTNLNAKFASKTLKNKNRSNDKLFFDISSQNNDEHNDSFELIEEQIANINKEKYIFDTFLISRNYSIYTIKSIFCCLCDKWEKNTKIKFIKSQNEDFCSFNNYMHNFNSYKKELFYQLLLLIEYINKDNLFQKSIKLIFSFMNDVISKYQEDPSNENSKIIFINLFEDKTIMKKFFSICLNNDNLINKPFKNFIIASIKFINNDVFLEHPKPYIFSFIKHAIKTEIPEVFIFIDDLFKSIINNILFKKNVSYYYLQNSIHFIKTLKKALEKYNTTFQNLFMKEQYKMFYSIQDFVIKLIKSDFAYDPNLYIIYNCLDYNENIKEKNYNKIIRSSNTKILNNRIIFLNLFEIAMNSIYILWKLQNKDKNIINICLDYIPKIQKEIVINQHFLIFYTDISNSYIKFSNKDLLPKIPENLMKVLNNGTCNDLNKKHIFSVREMRIISILFILILMKYQSLLIKYEKLKVEYNLEISIKEAFKSFIDLSFKENKYLIPNIGKTKENKNYDVIMEKEESKSKEFKDYNKNFYKYFFEKFKNKNYDIINFIEEIENKFSEDSLKKKETKKNNKIKVATNFLRKNSDYNKIEENYNNDEIEKEKNMNNKNNIENKNSNEIIIENNNEKVSLDFGNIKNPILCTKRDLILKNFGYFYYQYYFRNDKFIKMKKVFFCNFNPKYKNNNYQGFEKIMKNKYPFTVKNFSNNNLYYPRVIYRPYHKLFENDCFFVSHSYFDNNLYDKKYKEKKMHFEYGHGLLNQNNFNLFIPSNKNEIMNDSLGSFISKGSIDDNISQFDSTFFESNEKNNNSLIYLADDFSYKKNKKEKNHLSKNINTILEKKMTFETQMINNNYSNSDNSSTKDETINILKFECEVISPKKSSNGFIVFNDMYLIYQVNTKFDKELYNKNFSYSISCSQSDLDQEEKQIIIPYNLISQILYRKFLYYEVAIEIFLLNGKSYYFNFYNANNKNQFMKKMKEKINEEIIISSSIKYFKKKKYKKKWLENEISTLDYLLLINKFSDRSYNVLSHYLILPWILFDFDDIYNSENLRNFNFPGLIKTKEEFNLTKKEDVLNGITYHFPNLFSNNMYVNHLSIRAYPYINNQIKLQDNRFDEPSRQFLSLVGTFNIFKENLQLNMELIPEFYFIPEFFLNINYCYYGILFPKKEKYLVNNLGIGPNFHSLLEIINYHQLNINSEFIISRINNWIDYIFGEHQIFIKKDTVYNFPKECYEIFVKEDIDEQYNIIKSSGKNNMIGEKEIKRAKSKIKAKLLGALFYGHCPTQLFNKNHPTFSKKLEPKIYNYTDIKNIQITLKNERIILAEKDNIYIQESSKGNYFYIVSENKILVYNKHLKLMNNLSINYINKFPYCYINKNNMKNNNFELYYNCKYLIFDIFDCKYFFIGGYMDNSLKIYYKETGKDVMYSIYLNSQIKCLRKSISEDIFFTGHENGKIIKWNFETNDDNNIINILKDKSIIGHKKSVKMIELNEKYECIISVDIDEIIFIRKLYDFELLSYIKLNKSNKKVIDMNIYNQILVLTVFKNKINEIFIYTYSLNGLKLGKIQDQLKLPITLIPNTDEIIIFSSANIYLAKIAFNEKTSLVTISNDLELSNLGLNLKNENDASYHFNEDLHITDGISYFYDCKNRVLFCLFSNGSLYRINVVKNA